MSSFYEEYFKLPNRKIVINMKNDDCIKGAITGIFYRNDAIYKWRVIIQNNPETAGLLNNQMCDEKVIFVKDIKSVIFDYNKLLYNF